MSVGTKENVFLHPKFDYIAKQDQVISERKNKDHVIFFVVLN